MCDVADIGMLNLILLESYLVEFGCIRYFNCIAEYGVFRVHRAIKWVHTNLKRLTCISVLYSYLGNARHQILNIRIYVVFEAFLLRYDLAQLGERMPQSLSNDVIKLLGVRVPVIANFYDPTTFLFVM